MPDSESKEDERNESLLETKTNDASSTRNGISLSAIKAAAVLCSCSVDGFASLSLESLVLTVSCNVTCLVFWSEENYVINFKIAICIDPNEKHTPDHSCNMFFLMVSFSLPWEPLHKPL